MRNIQTSNTFFRAGFIESWGGRGIEKICNLCKEYGIAETEYTVHPNDTVNDTVKTILALIEQNPSLTYEEMTEKTGKSRRTISRIITEMKEKNIIARVGSDKNGHWEIVKNENRKSTI